MYRPASKGEKKNRQTTKEEEKGNRGHRKLARLKGRINNHYQGAKGKRRRAKGGPPTLTYAQLTEEDKTRSLPPQTSKRGREDLPVARVRRDIFRETLKSENTNGDGSRPYQSFTHKLRVGG